MNAVPRWIWAVFSTAAIVVNLGLATTAAEPKPVLDGTAPLTGSGNFSEQMVSGIDRFLSRKLEQSVADRQKLWKRDFSSREAYEKSVEGNREHLRRIVGEIDKRVPVKEMQLIATTLSPPKIAETADYTISAARWPVFGDVQGEGLLLEAKKPAGPRIIALPDADQTPEMITGLAPGLSSEAQLARRLAEQGCVVLVPTLISRDDSFSGNAATGRFTNQPHREWIYRQAFEVSRHIIGYEVQKVLAAVDWFENTGAKQIGIAGYGEGGLIALYAAAVDTRVNATLVSGYFDNRQRVWGEPIYRNVFGLLREFGDAEIASLIAPRGLVIEHSIGPRVSGPPAARNGRNGAGPGTIETPDYERVENEFNRFESLVKSGGPGFTEAKLICGTEGMATGPGSDRALLAFLAQLGVKQERIRQANELPTDLRQNFDSSERQRRHVQELVNYTQKLCASSEHVREEFFWRKVNGVPLEKLSEVTADLKKHFHEEVIGKINDTNIPMNPRSRLFTATDKWTGYEVMLDVFPDVFAWGLLLLPNDLKPGERRPVVVCQHGLNGLPADVMDTNTTSEAYAAYKAFGARLAERGFVVFAPHNPTRGDFRTLVRKANPLGLSLFSIIIPQHERVLDWLSAQPFVDPARIGFYGLSYGGKTALRVPAVVDRYALSICSGDFNDWIRKMTSLDLPASYMFTHEYEIYEFGLGNTFSHAEMAALIAPRPFMVERGHQDGVGIDEWVASEYAKVRRFYDQLGIGDRTEIEFFNGPHTIHGEGTFRFLQQNLKWGPK